MPRQVRIQFPGAFYHVMASGNHLAPIYNSDDDYLLFLELLAEVCGKTGWCVHAYALMGNHYHLVVETPQPNLVYGMSRLQTSYTARFNARHQIRGQLFGDRYKAIPVQQGEGDYFRTLIDYVHLNPVRAGLVDPSKRIDTHPWTSLSYYKLPPSKRLPWQNATDGLHSTGHPDTTSGRRKFLESLERQAKAQKAENAGLTEIEDQGLQSTLRRGWYFGTHAFRDKLIKLAGITITKKRTNPNYRGPELRKHGKRQATDIIKRGLFEFNLKKSQLPGLAKNDWQKSLIALAIKRETSMPLAWITSQLKMGATSGVSRYTADIATRLGDKAEKKLRSHYKRIVQIPTPCDPTP